ncbi:hypothetical protein OHV13_34140 [Kitasatospora purpeofusca]|uniref:hypothetical protein n=1 Tax=Kitasatospora purpeofusca TaxID=67352 RepID=UPI00324FBBDF
MTTSTATTSGKVLYDGCRFADTATAATALRWSGPAPWYEFRDCLGEGVRIPDTKAP